MIKARCRSCGASPLSPIVSLGEMPLANSFLLPEELTKPEPRYPLDLMHCQACQLVQIACTVPPEVLFREYLYLSSTSTTLVVNAEHLVTRLVRARALGAHNLVVEVGSNDGYLLQHYMHAGVPVLGVEPARNVAVIARGKGIRTVDEFFNAERGVSLRAEYGAADVIHVNNVLAHVADLNSFVAGLRELLATDGVIVSESPYLGSFLAHVEFDTIYHEHLCYYSLTSLVNLFRRHGLEIEAYESLPIHGGSMRIFVRHAGSARPEALVAERLAEERAWDDTRFADFAAGIARVKHDVTTLVRALRARGHRVCAYGAAAKGTVLLNACGLGTADLDFVCDSNPLKQGRFMPGVHIPIVASTQLLAGEADYCLLLVWNIADEIIGKQAAWVARGGKFIVPIPTVQVRPV